MSHKMNYRFLNLSISRFFFVFVMMLVSQLAGAVSSVSEANVWQVVLVQRREPGKDLSALTLQDVVDPDSTSPEVLKRYGDITIESSPANSDGSSSLEFVQPSQVMAALSRAGVDLSHILVRPAGNENASIGISKKGEDLKDMQKVVVANSSIVSGASVTAGSFHEERQIVNGPDDFIHGLSELGSWSWEALQSIAPGEPVHRGSLKSPVILQKGSVVTLCVRNQRFQVHALGRVKEVLDSGASVSVENMDSKKIVIGRPLNGNEVEIVF